MDRHIEDSHGVFASSRKTMPAMDYVSVIRSVYGDGRALVSGAVASAAAAALSALKAGSIELALVSLLMLAVGYLRYFNSLAFKRAQIGNEDVEAAEYWEGRAVLGGALVALSHGLWCFVAIAIVRDPFAELASCTLSIAGMVGIVARNFGLDRLVAVQAIVFSVPLWLAMMLRGDAFHFILGLFLIAMLVSFRKLASDIRAILLAAVHGRYEASRLAEDLDFALDTMTHGVMMIERSGRISLANDRVREMLEPFGVEIREHQSLAELFRAMPAAQLRGNGPQRITDLVENQGSGKVLLSLAPGTYFEITVSSRATRSVLLCEDISERVKAEERISFMARYDTLTGLINRSYVTELIGEDLDERAEALAAGEPVRQVGLLLIDIDDFKTVNDSLGHAAGDSLLRGVAARLRAVVGTGNVLARLGGDEFVIYLPRVSGTEEAETMAADILEAFAQPFLVDAAAPMASATIGVVVSHDGNDGLDALMAKADLALYTAKAGGKRHFQRFHAGMDVDFQYRQKLKADLSEALESDGLDIALQPLVDIQSGRVVSCEALVRWTHPQWGPIAPSVFIPLAEEMGVIERITRFMLHRATRECVQWPEEIGVAVNISARDFRSGRLEAEVNEALRESGLPASRLELEITESALIEHRDAAVAQLRRLARQGISIALDDFGTGYSSLSYLQALPFTKLKIDRSFLADIENGGRALNLLANVARLGSELDMVVTAEGVETENQLELLRRHTRVQQVQGYLFSRPLPARDIGELIARLNAARAQDRSLPVMVNHR
jgi:diguanylate cyclase (GGDEF)-like protein